MSDLTFRLAQLDDLDQLIDLRVSMQMEVNRAPEPGASYRNSVAAYFTENLRSKQYASSVAEVDGSLVAAAGLVIYTKPPSIGATSGKVGYISNVYTLPEWRRRGISRELMKILIDYARAEGISRLHLGATDAGVSVYEGVGFKTPSYRHFELKL